ncbi:autotransporter domain-containing protein [Aquipseudomonas campi]
MSNLHNTRLSPGRKTILAVAVAATLANSFAAATPGDQIISAPTGGVNWTDGNLTVLPGGSITSFSSTLGVTVIGPQLGILSNSGTISADSHAIANQQNAVTRIDKIINTSTGVIEANNYYSSAIVLNSLISSVGSIDNSGRINGNASGIDNNTSITVLTNSGTITSSSNGSVPGGTGILNAGVINTLHNTSTGTIGSNLTIPAGTHNVGIGLLNANNATLSALINDGLIQSSTSTSGSAIALGGAGVSNNGLIMTLDNNGTIRSTQTGGSSVGAVGIRNEFAGTLYSLTNDGTISAQGSQSKGIHNSGSIGSLHNTNLIVGEQFGLYNQGSAYGIIGLLLNDAGASIQGDEAAIQNAGSTIGALINSGLIDGGSVGISNTYGGHISTLINNAGGTISGSSTAIYNEAYGTIGTLNNSGLIRSDEVAIWNGGVLGPINNSGTIAGKIINETSDDLIINGASGTIAGVLTGSNGSISAQDVGLIQNRNGNVLFNTGKLLLNDNIEVVDTNAGSLGTLYSVMNNGATLQINNDITLWGNYTQAAGAGLVFGVADNAQATGNPAFDGGYGRLYVNGAVTLTSGTSVGLTKTGSTYAFAQGQRYLVIGATDGASSEFNENTLNYTLAANGLRLTGENVALSGNPGANGLVLTVVGSSSNAINGATTRDARSSLGGLFQYQGTDEQLMNLARAGAALGSSGNNGGAQLSPTSTASAAATASTGSTQQVFEVASSHMDSLRTAQAGNGSSGIASGEQGNTGGLWGQAFGGSSRQDEREDIAGYHANYHGMLLGADAQLNDSWRAGGLFSYANTSVNNDGANKHSSADVDSYGLIAYATYTANPWYLNLSAGAVQHQYGSKREIDIVGFNGTAKGSYDGMQYLAAAQAGYPIDLGSSTTLTPIAGLTYSTLKLDSYTEKGGNGAALHIKSTDIDSLKSDLGVKLERSFATTYGELTPVAQLTWRHEFRDEGLRSVANFAADVAGETSFASNGPSAINDTGVLNLGVTLVRSDRLSLAARYTLEAGSGYTANTGNLQARWNF